MTTVRAEKIEIVDGEGNVRATIGMNVNGQDLAIHVDGNDIIAFTPVVHPQGNGPVATGHRLAWLNQNNEWLCDVVAFVSDDPTVGAGGVFFQDITGAALARDFKVHKPGAMHWVQINFAGQNGNTFPDGSTHPVFVHTVEGETAEQFAHKCYQAVLDDPILQAAGIGAQYPSTAMMTDFAVTRQATSPIVNVQTITQNSGIPNNTRIPRFGAINPGDTLDAAPIIAIKRRVPGRILKPEDSFGQIIWGDDTGYYVLAAIYAGAEVGGPGRGMLREFVRWDGAVRPIMGKGPGIAMFSRGTGEFGQGAVQAPWLDFGKVSQI